MIVYCKDKNSLKRLNELKRKAAETLASDRRYDKADNAYSEAKKKFAEAHLTESLASDRGDLYSSFMNLLSLQDYAL